METSPRVPWVGLPARVERREPAAAPTDGEPTSRLARDVPLTTGGGTLADPLSGLGYGADGAPRVFSVVPGTPLGGTALRPEFLLFAGRTFAAGETDGEVAIAAEYALRGGAWVLVDSTGDPRPETAHVFALHAPSVERSRSRRHEVAVPRVHV